VDLPGLGIRVAAAILDVPEVCPESGMGTAASILGRWMADTWQWDAFVTLTFRDPPPTPENAARGYTRIGARGGENALLDWLHKSVVPRAPGAFWWFVEEHHQFRSTPHFHGLLGGVEWC